MLVRQVCRNAVLIGQSETSEGCATAEVTRTQELESCVVREQAGARATPKANSLWIGADSPSPVSYSRPIFTGSRRIDRLMRWVVGTGRLGVAPETGRMAPYSGSGTILKRGPALWLLVHADFRHLTLQEQKRLRPRLTTCHPPYFEDAGRQGRQRNTSCRSLADAKLCQQNKLLWACNAGSSMELQTCVR
jgi:hypothetical protein